MPRYLRYLNYIFLYKTVDSTLQYIAWQTNCVAWNTACHHHRHWLRRLHWSPYSCTYTAQTWCSKCETSKQCASWAKWTRLELKVMLSGKKDSSSETSQKNSIDPVLMANGESGPQVARDRQCNNTRMSIGRIDPHAVTCFLSRLCQNAIQSRLQSCWSGRYHRGSHRPVVASNGLDDTNSHRQCSNSV